jgi:serine/threonine-protein kinase
MDTGARERSVEADLTEGVQVGEYVIEGKIGEGGFGTVYRAAHPLIGKLAAVKVLSRKFSSDPEMVSRFVAEARAVNQIRHRNIIDIFGFGELPDGRSYYVMELLDGEPLDARIADGGGVPVSEALPILRAVARALDAAHAKGIAHRDLKPENVFLARDSEGGVYPKLLDFGIAKLLGETGAASMHRTRTGSPIGTPYYMSPEQCRGQNVDHRTDIYSFGCVAYEVLTGKTPFEGENHLELLMKQTTEEPVPPTERAAENAALPPLPPAIDDAIAWLMKKEPGERPPNLDVAIRALEDAAGLPEALRRTPALGTPIHRAQSHGGPAGDGSAMRATPMPRASSQRTPAHGTTALAKTVSASTLEPLPRSRKTWWIAGAAALAVAGTAAIAFVAMHGEDKQPAPPAPIATPAPAPAPAPTPPPAPEPPRFVTLHVTGTAAQVFGPEGPLGTVPGDVQLPRGESLQLTFTADGFATKTERVPANADSSLELALVAKKAPPHKAVSRPTLPAPAVPKADPYSRK